MTRLSACVRSDRAVANLKRYYFDRDLAEKRAEALRSHEAKDGENAVIQGTALSEMLTTQMRDAGHDMHLVMECSQNPLPSRLPCRRLRKGASSRGDATATLHDPKSAGSAPQRGQGLSSAATTSRRFQKPETKAQCPLTQAAARPGEMHVSRS